MRARKFAEIEPVIKAQPASCLGDMKARQSRKIGELRKALVEAGFETLRQQAAILGLSPSSAWAVLEGAHKGSGLSAITIKRVLASPSLPPEARQVVEEYICERLLGGYGHSHRNLKLFRKRLGYPTSRTIPTTELNPRDMLEYLRLSKFPDGTV